MCIACGICSWAVGSQEVAMAAMVVYQEHQSHGLDENNREILEDSSGRRPISASEVEEASNLVFRRSSNASGDSSLLGT